MLTHAQAVDLQGPDGALHASRAATALVGGLFEIAEIYNAAGLKLSEEMTPIGHELENLLPKHGTPAYTKPFYESMKLSQNRWVMRVMVPLQGPAAGGAITGYFEGVRLVPDWQQAHIQSDALAVALMVCLASLLCGAFIYPVVIHLAGENERRAQQVLRVAHCHDGCVGQGHCQARFGYRHTQLPCGLITGPPWARRWASKVPICSHSLPAVFCMTWAKLAFPMPSCSNPVGWMPTK